ncbi:putative autotransporter adhesin-like protein [Mariniflexile fucanivorans]|uniref:Putative autotransporter adhesin-like protein n=1 Tax=Mariniflexile fucanivorans TaxID=264023 RepID=A0A4R1RCU5_9FLAO|nr:head GIN domain-containing protein [Mariniflexile fucanivorans]TCL63420.1 putative autotransporter adhesin-like protein [Mariniflexile fucanivorans]
MKKLTYILTLIILFSCNSENAGDCFQTTGTIIQQEISVSAFDKILVNRDVELIIKEGLEQKVIIETGKNLINDVEAVVLDGRLILTDNNSCNYVRDYGVTKIYVTSQNITEIRSSTQYDVSSDGVLTYPALTILAEDYNAPDSFTSGNFRLQIDNDNFNLVFNNLSNCYISGNTNNLNITFAAGTSRFEGANLIAQNVVLWNRSSNDMIVNPQQSIIGTISGTGNIISVTTPPIIDVQELYKGRLIFN